MRTGGPGLWAGLIRSHLVLHFGILHAGDSEVRLEVQDKFATVFLLIMCIIMCILNVLILTSLLNYFTFYHTDLPGAVSVANKKACQVQR